MHWDVAITAKDYHVFIFIISTVAYDTLSVFLGSKGPAPLICNLLDHFDIDAFTISLFHLHHAENVEILIIVLPLNCLLHMLEELSFLPRRVANV
jgi:hypothetical protein